MRQEIFLDAEEIKDALAQYIKTKKNIEVNKDSLFVFCTVEEIDGSDDIDVGLDEVSFEINS
ncbi:hypothetical protein D3C71_2208710 [compost metagenome]